MLTLINQQNYKTYEQLHLTASKKLGFSLNAVHKSYTPEGNEAYLIYNEPSNNLLGHARLRAYSPSLVSDEILDYFGLNSRSRLYHVDQLQVALNPSSPLYSDNREHDHLLSRFFQSIYSGLLRFALPRMIDLMIIESSQELYEDCVLLGCWPYKSGIKPFRHSAPETDGSVLFSLLPVDESAFTDFKIRLEGSTTGFHSHNSTHNFYF